MRSLFTLFSFTLFVFALFEVGIRLFDFKFYSERFGVYHPKLGWTHAPDLNVSREVTEDSVDTKNKWRNHYKGYQWTQSSNSLGFHDIEHPITKPNNTKRIVVLGDSMTEAVQVNIQDTYASQLENLLNENTNEKWEVINLGAGDYGNFQELIMLEQFGLSYEPDIVILQIFPLNDVCNNSIELYRRCNSLNDFYRPYFVGENGNFKIIYAQPIRQFIRKYFFLYRSLEKIWLHESYSRGFLKETPDDQLQFIKREGLLTDTPVLNIYRTSLSSGNIIEQAWRQTEEILKEIVNKTNNYHLQLIPLIIPFENEHPKKHQKYKNWDANYPEERLRRFFENLNVSAVSVKKEFISSSNDVYPYIDGHLNSQAHRIVAEKLFFTIRNASLKN